MSHAPPQMSTDDATAATGLPGEFALLRDFPRPMSCRLNEPGITTDDAQQIAELVDMIDEGPHYFAEQFLALVRRVDALERRMHGAIR